MRVLTPVVPTPEQLTILLADTFSVTIVRGAAGSGKTTSAALRARKVLAGVATQRRLDADPTPIRALVLTFNRTLKGYIEEFINVESRGIANVVLHVNTFAGWACSLVGFQNVIEHRVREDFVYARWMEASPRSVLSKRFIANEVAYILGRFGRSELDSYIACSRSGRGAPSLLPVTRRNIIDAVILPYLSMLNACHLIDWTDYARLVMESDRLPSYDVVIADEVQDFGVQQLRGIMARMKERSSKTFVIDNGQSIYPQVIHWDEVPLHLGTQASVYELHNNYRNTAQIAEFVQPLLQGMPLTADGTVPDFRNCKNEEIGRTPELIDGLFNKQVAYAIRELSGFPIDERVAILTCWGDTKGEIAKQLNAAGIPWVTLTQEKDWPSGDEVVAISTLHSAKGLEFEHVFILGFDVEFLDAYGDENDAAAYLEQRRLLAMAITRAKRTVFIGYRSHKRSSIFDLFDPARFILRRV